MPGFIKTPEDEKVWEDAKRKVHERYDYNEDSDHFWRLTNAVYQKMRKSISYSGTLDRFPQIMAVDFDETLDDEKFPDEGDPMNGVKEALKWYHHHHGVITIWTCRSGDALFRAIRWMKRNNIPYDHVNENPPSLGFETSSKIYADLYVDNRGFFPGWPELLKMLKEAYHHDLKKSAKVPPGLDEAYQKAYKKEWPSGDSGEKPKWSISAEGPHGVVWMSSDGWGDFYFLVSKGSITHLATKAPDAQAGYVKEPLRSFATSQGLGKGMGFGDANWNKLMRAFVTRGEDTMKKSKFPAFITEDIGDEQEAIDIYTKQISQLEAEGKTEEADKIRHILGQEKHHKTTLQHMSVTMKHFVDPISGRLLIKGKKQDESTITKDGKTYKGIWRTVHGAKVFIVDGKVVAGPDNLVGKNPKQIRRQNRKANSTSGAIKPAISHKAPEPPKEEPKRGGIDNYLDTQYPGVEGFKDSSNQLTERGILALFPKIDGTGVRKVVFNKDGTADVFAASKQPKGTVAASVKKYAPHSKILHEGDTFARVQPSGKSIHSASKEAEPEKEVPKIEEPTSKPATREDKLGGQLHEKFAKWDQKAKELKEGPPKLKVNIANSDSPDAPAVPSDAEDIKKQRAQAIKKREEYRDRLINHERSNGKFVDPTFSESKNKKGTETTISSGNYQSVISKVADGTGHSAWVSRIGKLGSDAGRKYLKDLTYDEAVKASKKALTAQEWEHSNKGSYVAPPSPEAKPTKKPVKAEEPSSTPSQAERKVNRYSADATRAVEEHQAEAKKDADRAEQGLPTFSDLSAAGKAVRDYVRTNKPKDITTDDGFGKLYNKAMTLYQGYGYTSGQIDQIKSDMAENFYADLGSKKSAVKQALDKIQVPVPKQKQSA